MKLQWTFITIWLLFATSAWSREIPNTISFPKETYGAQNQNWMLAHLPNQMLAVANSAGLMLFNGNRWSVYPLPDNQIVRAIAIDEEGTIFGGGYDTFGYWKGDEYGRLVYHDLSKTSSSTDVLNGEIWNILVQPGRVIFQTFSKIYIYDYEQVHTIVPPGTIMFLSEIEGRLLVPSLQYGIFELDTNDGFKLCKGTEKLAGKRVAAILPLDQGTLLIGTQNSGFYIYQHEKVSPINNSLYNRLSENQLNRAIKLDNGNYAFGTILNGIYITDSTTQQLLFHLNKENGLENNTVLSLLEDPHHNLWVGLDKGINYIELNGNLIFYNDQSIDIGSMYAARLYQNQLYAGTNQGVFYKKMPLANNEYNDGQFNLIPGSQGQVWQLAVFDEQLLAGHNLGTFLIEQNQLKPVSSMVGGWCTIPVPDQPDLLLQATYTGIGLLKKGTNGQWILSHQIEGFSSPLKKILFDKKGNVWGVNPYKGLFLFELDANFEKIRLQKRFTLQEGLPTEFRVDLFLVGEQLVIQSGEQFFVPNDMGTHLMPVQSIGQTDLSPGNYKLIYFSEKEYFKVYPNYVEWFLNGKKQRLNIALIPNYEKIVPLTDQIILFCLDQGYALLDRRKKDETTQHTHTPLISEIKVNGKYNLYPIFQKDMTQPWIFAPSEKQLHFSAGLPGLAKEELLEYRLSGYDENWQVFDSYNKEFTNLPPGDYQFQLRVGGADNSQTFSFIILPKWYQTTWATALYYWLFAALLWVVYIIQEKRLKLHIRKLRIEKERQLHLQRMQARNEQLQANILNKSKELANTTMNLIRKNEILIKIKNQLNKVKSNTPNRTSFPDAQKLLHIIDHHLTNEQDWELFEQNFSQVHDSFFKKLKEDYPELTPGDLKLAAYLKMNLSSKEIAPLLNISIRGVENKRYRLRCKLGLDSSDNLTELMMRY